MFRNWPSRRIHFSGTSIETMNCVDGNYHVDVCGCHEEAVALKAENEKLRAEISNSKRIENNQDREIEMARYDRDVWYKAHKQTQAQLSKCVEALRSYHDPSIHSQQADNSRCFTCRLLSELKKEREESNEK